MNVIKCLTRRLPSGISAQLLRRWPDLRRDRRLCRCRTCWRRLKDKNVQKQKIKTWSQDVTNINKHEVDGWRANTFFIFIGRPNTWSWNAADGCVSDWTAAVSSLLKYTPVHTSALLIPPSLFWDTWPVQQSHILLVRWKILIALIKEKLITPWRKFSLSAFTLHSGGLLTICPFLFIHRPTGRPDPAAFAKTRSRALTGRRIITERHTSIMLFNSHRGVQTSDRTPRLIHYWQGN